MAASTKKNSSNQFTISIIVLLTLTSMRVTSGFSLSDISDIERFAGDVISCANIPGLALGIIRKSAKYSTGLGVAHMETAYSADGRTIFNLGSTAKALVPYVLAEIMNNGRENSDDKMHWNSTLKEMILYHLDIEVTSPWADLTLQEMLIYKSGSSAADMSTMSGLPAGVTREEIIRRTRFLPNAEDFKHSNHYSNIMYTIAGHLAERMSGMSWSDLVKVRVLDKQNMNASSFAPEGMTHEDAALPYRFHPHLHADPFVMQDKELFNLHPFEPVGSLMASADDVTKWLSHILHSLQAKEGDSGINYLIRDAFHPWVTVPDNFKEGFLSNDFDKPIGYGMGWLASTYRDLKRYKYSGGLYAYHSEIWLFPEVQSGIFVSINGPGNDNSSRALEGIMYYIADIILEKMPWVTKENACSMNGGQQDKDNYDFSEEEAAPLESRVVHYLSPTSKYIGVYGNGIVGDAVVQLNEANILVLRVGRNLAGELLPGDRAGSMNLIVTGPLQNTEEWSQNKSVEFLLSPDGNESQHFDIVRIHVTSKLHYDFQRGKLFEGLLVIAEEEDEKEMMQQGANVVTPSDRMEESSPHEENTYGDNNNSNEDVGHGLVDHSTTARSTETQPETTDQTPELDHSSNQDNKPIKSIDTEQHIGHGDQDTTESSDKHKHYKEDSLDNNHDDGIEDNMNSENIDNEKYQETVPYNVNHPESHDNDVASSREQDTEKLLNPDSHQSHEPYNMDMSPEELEKERHKESRKLAEAAEKASDKKTPRGDPGNLGLPATTTPFILVVVSLVFTVLFCCH
ncbi:unnamed protein product [Lymnaea stagnalis]|uniref:Beta-lactamase-related domain-containing protein n=1 Tax=Lymnaea stagnalis TaxID=6523 RepID=A0AAV2I2D0_LYMST